MVREVGGKNISKYIQKAMDLTLTNSLTYKMTWTGQKNKIETQNMKFITIIIGI